MLSREYNQGFNSFCNNVKKNLISNYGSQLTVLVLILQYFNTSVTTITRPVKSLIQIFKGIRCCASFIFASSLGLGIKSEI